MQPSWSLVHCPGRSLVLSAGMRRRSPEHNALSAAA